MGAALTFLNGSKSMHPAAVEQLEQNGMEARTASAESGGTAKPAKQHTFLIAFAVTTLFSLLVKCAFVITYGTNDDPGVSMICSGCGWAFAPDYHILFANSLFGRALVALYGWNKQVPWYGLYLFGANFIATWACTYSLIYKRALPSAAISTAAFLMMLALPNLSALQFTAASALLGLGGFGLLLCWEEDRAENNAKPSLIMASAAVFCLVLSGMLRLHMLLVLTLLAGAFFVFRAMWRNGFNVIRRENWPVPLVLMAVAFAVSTAFQFVDDDSYKRVPGWERSRNEHKAVVKFTDYGFGRAATTEQLAELRRFTTWNANDLEMLQNLFAVDSVRYSLERLEAGAKLFASSHGKSPLEIETYVNAMLIDPLVKPFLVTLAVMLVVGCGTYLPRTLLLAWGAVFAGLFCWLAYDMKLPPHLYVPIFAVYVFAPFYYLGRGAEGFGHGVWKYARGLASVVLVAWLSWNSVQHCTQRNNRIAMQNKLLKQAIAELQPKSNQLYCTFREFFPTDVILPFDSVYDYFGNMHLLPFGFNGDMPVARVTMEKFDIRSDNFGERLCSDDLFLASHPDLNELLKKYLWDHYQIRAETVLQRDFAPLNLAIYKVRKMN